MDAPVRISLLGPVGVHTEQGLTPVAGVKLQSLLAILALAAPHVVSCDRLFEELWGDEQPGNPANALQALASHLRKVLGADAIVRQGAGYVLRLDPDLIDAARLERLVGEGLAAAERGDTAAAADRFRAAIELVHGPPLSDLVEHWFAREASVRLEELVLAAHEGLIDIELATGRHADVLTTLVDLVAQHPVRERFRAQLIIALYRAGRQADALREYRQARQYLADELGLDPGPELQSLERAVLAHDPALAAPITLTPIAAEPSPLPAPLTSFVGRIEELERLERSLAASRLTTVVGPGGVGKTRLVLELARRLEAHGEVCFVELAPVSQPMAVAEAIAAAVGAPERAGADGQPAPSPQQRTVERLGQREAIVILDNCEHVAETAASCALTVIGRCRNVRVVATSREPLGIEGEQQLALGPLDDDASTALFTDRARSIQPLFSAGDAGDTDLVDLCRHLDGLPLAIELAAARTKTLPVPEIADRLRDRFHLLRRTQRTGTARHQGLEAAIDWSYELLFEDERRTFRRLAVCPGGATVDAAERLCGPDAYELASRLVDRSLLVADTTGRTVRFEMLESLRAYGMERLVESGEVERARAEHLQWCIDLAERVDREVRRSDQLEWLQRLDREHDNVRAALDHAVEHDPASALRLVAAVILPWWFRGKRQETRYWSEAALAAGAAEDPVLRARVLASSGLVAEPVGRGEDGSGRGVELHEALLLAERRQREAIEICAAGADDADLATGQLVLLSTLTRRASAGEVIDRDEAGELITAAAERFDRLGDDFGSAVVRMTGGILAIIFGDLWRAREFAAAAAPFAHRSGDRFSLSRIEYVHGMLADLEDRPHEAYRHIERSLRLMDELGIHQAVTAQARLLVPLADRCGQPELAEQWRVFIRDRGDGWTHYDGTAVASARNRVGLDARAAGDLQRAAEAHMAALEWYTAVAIPSAIAFTQSCLGFLTAQRRDVSAAAAHHAAALAAAIDAGDPLALALALEGCAATASDPSDAARLLGAAATRWAAAPSTTTPTHRDDVATVGGAARARLGPDGYAGCVAEGTRLDDRAAAAIARRATGGRATALTRAGVAAALGTPATRAGSATRTSPTGR